MGNSTNEKEMGVLSRIIGVFSSPRETFVSLDRRPTWLVPFIILVIAVVVMQVTLRGVQAQEMVARLEARGMPQEQIEAIQARMQGPASYIGLVVAPIFMLIVWAVIAGLLWFGGNTIMGGTSTFKKMFSLVAWSGLIGFLGIAVKTFLILSKGTTVGVTTSLAAFLPSPELGAAPGILYRLLSKFDLFTIWEMVLWTIGISVMYKFTMKKSACLVGTLWILWIVVSVALGGVFARFGM